MFSIFPLYSVSQILINFQQQPERRASGKTWKRNVEYNDAQSKRAPTHQTSSRAHRNERTARLANRRALLEPTPARGTDIESEAWQLTRKTGHTRHSTIVDFLCFAEAFRILTLILAYGLSFCKYRLQIILVY